MNFVIEVSGVSRRYRQSAETELTVLRDINLVVNPGETVAIVGRSGSGKSTLLNILGLLERPSGGSYVVAGVETQRLRDRARARLRGTQLGFIFQQFHLLERRSALDNVAEPLLYAPRADRRLRRQRALDLLDQVGLASRALAKPNTLSGGEQQRVAIARALVRNPGIILADEPTGSLDPATGERVLELLFQLVSTNGHAMILVTHDQEVARKADRTLVLADGILSESIR